MKKPIEKVQEGTGWLLFFYSVPTKPAANRIKIWRRLLKAGAVLLKGAVYALPYSEEHYELFQWLASEVASMRGEAAFIKTGGIESMKDSEVIALFNRQREEAYRSVDKGLDELERKINTVRNASGVQEDNLLSGLLNKRTREFEELERIDFFYSKGGSNIRKRITGIGTEITALYNTAAVNRKDAQVIRRRIEDYQGRTWVTRKKPFIDRMASAWLIKRFIDEKSAFEFIDEKDIEGLSDDVVVFDMRDGEFTHVGGLCTFEVLMKSFNLKDKALKAMAEAVHELDVKDDRYITPEARGVEDILTGIKKTARSDLEALEKGMAVFEMLYVSKR